MNARLQSDNPVEEFRAAMLACGITPPEHIIGDGKLHRFSTNSDRGDDAGWYVLHLDGVPAGSFGDWRTGLDERWCAKRGRTMSAAEEARIDLIKAIRAQDEQRRHDEAAERSAAIWNAAAPASSDHAYLMAKGIQPLGLRVDSNGDLIVPVKSGNQWMSLQRIAANGEKRFQYGGKIAGGYFPIGTPQEAEQRGLMAIAEGVATAASIYDSTGIPTMAAFSANNLLPVARLMRDRYPERRLLICADDDFKTNGNPGLTQASAASAAICGILARPEFAADRPEGASDFNDMAKAYGAQTVKACIERALAAPIACSSEPDASINGPVTLADFYAYMPTHLYIFAPSREFWPGSSVNARLPPIKTDAGRPISPNAWLDANQAVEQMTWAPGEPRIIEDRIASNGAWITRKGCRCFNLYRPSDAMMGDAGQAAQWIDHVHRVFPDDAAHVIQWLAHRVQRPGEKINHAIVLSGNQGVGKDTILEPVKYAVGPWNFADVSPKQMTGRFNGFLKSVILRINEARDLGEADRYAFYEHTKVYCAAPPDALLCDEKNLREHSVMNVLGVIITTNHRGGNSIYLPADDRRHYVALSPRAKEDFQADYWRGIYGWYVSGGFGHVAAYLATLDLSDFDPKAPPAKTPAFWAIVDANRAPEDAELADVIDDLGHPVAVTLAMLDNPLTDGDFRTWLQDRRNRRQIPHRLESAGYTPVRNAGADDGLWKVGKRRQAIYARKDKSERERIGAANEICQQGRL